MSSGYAMSVEEAEPMAYKVEPKKKIKKIGFFKRWMLKAVKDAVDAERNINSMSIGQADIVSAKNARIGRSEPAHLDSQDKAIHFTVYVASGGRVVETRRYDRKTERSSNGLYVITNEQDFGKEIDKIITMEALKQ